MCEDLGSCPVQTFLLSQFVDYKTKENYNNQQQQNSGQGSLIEFPNITELINVKGSIQTQVHCNLIEIFFLLDY